MHDISKKKKTDISEHCNVYHTVMKSNMVIKVRVKFHGFSSLTLPIRTGHGEALRKNCMGK